MASLFVSPCFAICHQTPSLNPDSSPGEDDFLSRICRYKAMPNLRMSKSHHNHMNGIRVHHIVVAIEDGNEILAFAKMFQVGSCKLYE